MNDVFEVADPFEMLVLRMNDRLCDLERDNPGLACTMMLIPHGPQQIYSSMNGKPTPEDITIEQVFEGAMMERGRPVVFATPVPMLLWCPECRARHIDLGEFATKRHTTHACQNCGHCWRPAVVATVGVQFLPGFKNAL